MGWGLGPVCWGLRPVWVRVQYLCGLGFKTCVGWGSGHVWVGV